MKKEKIRILEMLGEPISYGGEQSVLMNMLSSFTSYDKMQIDLFSPYFADNKELMSLIEKNGGNNYYLNLPFKNNDNRFKLTKHIEKFFSDRIHSVNQSNETVSNEDCTYNKAHSNEDCIYNKAHSNENHTYNKAYSNEDCTYNKAHSNEDCIYNKAHSNDVCPYDVVHIHTGSLSTMCMYAWVAKKCGIKKVIVHSHTAGAKQTLFSNIRKQILGNIMYNFVDLYLGCSKDAIESKFIPKTFDKSLVVNNGINISKFVFNSNYNIEIRKQYSINEKFVIGSLGRLGFPKNHEFMIEILKEISKICDNCLLMIVGTGTVEDKTKLEKLVNTYNLIDKVIFAGNQVETFKYYCAFDCFVLPSIYEGMPVVAIESQISGLPTLISDKVTKECNISSGAKYLPIDNAKLWATEILKIKSQVEAAKKQGNERLNFDIDFEKFDRNKTFKVVEDIYLNLCQAQA